MDQQHSQARGPPYNHKRLPITSIRVTPRDHRRSISAARTTNNPHSGIHSKSPDSSTSARCRPKEKTKVFRRKCLEWSKVFRVESRLFNQKTGSKALLRSTSLRHERSSSAEHPKQPAAVSVTCPATHETPPHIYIHMRFTQEPNSLSLLHILRMYVFPKTKTFGIQKTRTAISSSIMLCVYLARIMYFWSIIAFAATTPHISPCPTAKHKRATEHRSTARTSHPASR